MQILKILPANNNLKSASQKIGRKGNSGRKTGAWNQGDLAGSAGKGADKGTIGAYEHFRPRVPKGGADPLMMVRTKLYRRFSLQ
jgi:hypothetical protein